MRAERFAVNSTSNMSADTLYEKAGASIQVRRFSLSVEKQKTDIHEVIGTKEACVLSGLSIRKIRALCKRKLVEASKPDGRWRIKLSSFLGYLNDGQTTYVLSGVNVSSHPKIITNNRDLVFISYSHKDAKFLKEFRNHISSRLEEKINFWSDTQITIGKKWRDEIEMALNDAKVAVLFVSANFFKSVFINTVEIPKLLESAEEDGATIMSVYLRYCDYEEYPDIVQYQAINFPDNPLNGMDENERDRTWVELIKNIKREIDNQ